MLVMLLREDSGKYEKRKKADTAKKSKIAKKIGVKKADKKAATKQKRLEDIKKEIEESILIEKGKKPEIEKEDIQEALEEEKEDDSIENKIGNKLRNIQSALLVYGKNVQQQPFLNVYGNVEAGMDTSYIYKAKGTEENYTPLRLGESASELSFEDLRDINENKKFKDRGFTNGTGKHIYVEKQERFKLYKMFDANFALNMVMYDLSLT
ncbi:MAG: hypothetical protein ABII01_00920 [Candidatus Woesearchaeota archaeon]